MPTITVPQEFADELATTFDEDIEQLRLDVGLLLSQDMPQTEIVDRVVRGGFGRPFAEWYVRQQATFGRDLRLIAGSAVPVWGSPEEKSRLRVVGGIFVFVGLLTLTASRFFLLASDELGFLALVVAILGCVLEITGAKQLAESKGYPASTGWWVLAFFWPFIVWYWLAEDRWDVSTRNPKQMDMAPPEAPVACAPPAEAANGAPKPTSRDAGRYVKRFESEGLDHAKEMFAKDHPDLTSADIYNAFAESSRNPSASTQRIKPTKPPNTPPAHRAPRLFAGWGQLDPVTYVIRVMSSYLVLATLVLVVHSSTGTFAFWPKRYSLYGRGARAVGTQNMKTDLIVGGLFVLGISSYAMTYRKRDRDVNSGGRR